METLAHQTPILSGTVDSVGLGKYGIIYTHGHLRAAQFRISSYSTSHALTSAMAYGCGDSGSRGRSMNFDISGSGTFRKGFTAMRMVP